MFALCSSLVNRRCAAFLLLKAWVPIKGERQRVALECTIYKVLADTGWRSSIPFCDLFRHPIDRFGGVPTFATQVLRRDVR
jgi:hypothetical protein